MKLPFSKIVAQCYDGASNMNGRHKGLATRVCKENPMAIHTHCYNHQLNLALESTCCEITEIRNALTSEVLKTKLGIYKEIINLDNCFMR